MTLSGNWLLILGVLITALILVTGPAQGMLPPEELQKKNLIASEILIGLVAEVGPAPAGWRHLLPLLPHGDPWVFTLNLTHAVKSSTRAIPGEHFKVLFVQEKAAASEISARRTGMSAVRVAPGDLVIVYAIHQDKDGQRLLLPLLAGLSVVHLTSSHPTR
jgi:translation initiation factor IF-1